MSKFINLKEHECAPSQSYNSGTCFSMSSLKKIISAYNNQNSETPINISNNKKAMIDELQQRLFNRCSGDEKCFIRQDFVKQLNDDEISNNTFRPQKPNGQYTWLRTSDIAKVMNQYMKVYPDFIFFGPVPRDFDDIYYELKNINLKKLHNSGVRQIGIVFNLDKSHQSGSHWTAMYVNLNSDKEEVSYFDSTGSRPPIEMKVLMNRLQSQFEDMGSKPEMLISRYEHQKGNSECGIYVMNYILERVTGKTLTDINNNRIKDKTMNEFRDIFFTQYGGKWENYSGMAGGKRKSKKQNRRGKSKKQNRRGKSKKQNRRGRSKKPQRGGKSKKRLYQQFGGWDMIEKKLNLLEQLENILKVAHHNRA